MLLIYMGIHLVIRNSCPYYCPNSKKIATGCLHVLSSIIQDHFKHLRLVSFVLTTCVCDEQLEVLVRSAEEHSMWVMVGYGYSLL
jgi:hypothetical protein